MIKSECAIRDYPAKRIANVVVAGVILLLVFIPILLVALLVKLTSRGPVIYWSNRVGVNNRVFQMPKFRTMRIDTPQMATHLMSDPVKYLTPIGGFLRRTSVDELPQLWTILVGDMSIVGPRPALFNQDDLIALRSDAGVDMITPGLTGWAQINGRDELPIPEKVKFDVEYMNRQSLLFDLKIIFQTVARVIHRQGVSH